MPTQQLKFRCRRHDNTAGGRDVRDVKVYCTSAPFLFVTFVGKTGGARGKRVGLSVGKRARVPRGYVQVLYDIQMNVLSVGKWINGRENLV